MIQTKERPILFSGPMVRAILEGRKAQTRRVAPIIWDTSKHWGDYDCWTFQHRGKPCIGFSTDNRGHETLTGFCPYGQPGDQLWVKETFYDSSKDDRRHPWTYRADCSVEEDLTRDFKWKPSIFMPRKASRLRLEIISVRVERLQDISDADALAEGVQPKADANIAALVAGSPETAARMEYYALWESINGAGSWAKNPWVFVIEFKRL